MAAPAAAIAQPPVTVTGRVIDGVTQEPLAGVGVGAMHFAGMMAMQNNMHHDLASSVLAVGV